MTGRSGSPEINPVAAEILEALDCLPGLAEWHAWEARTLTDHSYELLTVEGLDRVIWEKDGRYYATDAALAEALAMRDGEG